MTTKEQREALEKVLPGTLTRTVDFLKFAEMKNAALLTFASAWFLALANLLASDRALPHAVRVSVAVSLLFFALAALVALYSFLPKVKLNAFHRDPDREKSLLYFEDTAEFEATAYVQRFRQRYAADTEQNISDHYLDDLAIQVFANSKITVRKFAIFNWAARLVMLALLGLTVTGAILAYNHLLAK
jgi:Pycsar effector protein